MSSRNEITGILHNFLGTYTSRYSDFDRYWLFGMIVGDMKRLDVDLLDSQAMELRPELSAPMRRAKQLAITKFRDQLEKGGLVLSCVHDARLVITKYPDPIWGTVNQHCCVGYQLEFSVKVVSDLGKIYERSKWIFVAPHNPEIEYQSAF